MSFLAMLLALFALCFAISDVYNVKYSGYRTRLDLRQALGSCPCRDVSVNSKASALLLGGPLCLECAQVTSGHISSVPFQPDRAMIGIGAEVEKLSEKKLSLYGRTLHMKNSAGDWERQAFPGPESDTDASSPDIITSAELCNHLKLKLYFKIGVGLSEEYAQAEALEYEDIVIDVAASVGCTRVWTDFQPMAGNVDLYLPESCDLNLTAHRLASLPQIALVTAPRPVHLMNAWAARILGGSNISDPLHYSDDSAVLSRSERWFDTITKKKQGGKFTGFTGEGQLITVGDSGLDVKHCFFNDSVPTFSKSATGCGSGSDGKVLCYVTRQGDQDDDDSHGTHVCGTIAGYMENGASLVHSKSGVSAHDLRGVAYGAQLLFFDLSSGTGIDTIDANDYIQVPHNMGSRIGSSSWGTTEGFSILGYGSEYDAKIEELRDFIFVAAAGNDGAQGSDVLGFNSRNPFFTHASPCSGKHSFCIGASRTSQDSWQTICKKTKFKQGTGVAAAEKQYCSFAVRSNIRDFKSDALALFSSRGPTIDGRVKPDFVAPGDFIFSSRKLSRGTCTMDDTSARNDRSFMSNQGTSMATPAFSGMIALLREYLDDRYDISNPSAALIRSLCVLAAEPIALNIILPTITGINAGESVALDRNDLLYPNHNYGYGRPYLRSILDEESTNTTLIMFDETHESNYCPVNEGDDNGYFVRYKFDIRKEDLTYADLRVSLSWLDKTVIDHVVTNDLDLIVVSPTGTIYLGNHGVNGGSKYSFRNVDIDNMNERVRIPGDTVANDTGTWYAYVHCKHINEGDDGKQPFAISFSIPYLNSDVDILASERGKGQCSESDPLIPYNPNLCWDWMGRGKWDNTDCRCKCGQDDITRVIWSGYDCSVPIQILNSGESVFYTLQPGDRAHVLVHYTPASTQNAAVRFTVRGTPENIEAWPGRDEIPWHFTLLAAYGRQCSSPLSTEQRAIEECRNTAINHHEIHLHTNTRTYTRSGQGDGVAWNASEVDVDVTALSSVNRSFPLILKEPGWYIIEVQVRDPLAMGTVEIHYEQSACPSACTAGGSCVNSLCSCFENFNGGDCSTYSAAFGHTRWLGLLILLLVLLL